MKTIRKKTYQIEYRERFYAVTLKEDDEGLIMEEFHPPELKNLLNPIQRISEDEFLEIWVKYIIGLHECREEREVLGHNLGALTFMVMDTIEQKGEITTPELVKILDCFSFALGSEGLPEAYIRQIYMEVLDGVIACFADRVRDLQTIKNIAKHPRADPKIFNIMKKENCSIAEVKRRKPREEKRSSR